MAPKKVGLRRINAAVNAMAQYGFPKGVVVSTVKKVLKEYGGDDGWFFIEDGGYRDLITIILDSQQEQQEKEDAGQTSSSATVATNIGSSGSANWKDISCVCPSATPGEVQGQNSVSLDVPPNSLSLPAPRRTRAPCYGWISEDEEE